jgi:hypothetical protein
MSILSNISLKTLRLLNNMQLFLLLSNDQIIGDLISVVNRFHKLNTKKIPNKKVLHKSLVVTFLILNNETKNMYAITTISVLVSALNYKILINTVKSIMKMN